MNLPTTIARSQAIVFCQIFYPDPQSTGQLLSLLLPQLNQGDARIEIICGFPTMPHFSAAQEDWRGIRVRRVGCRDQSRRGLPARLFAYLSYLTGAFRALRTTGLHTLVVACTNPPLLPLLVSWVLSPKARYHLILQDLYPEGLERLGLLGHRRVLANLWRRLNRTAYARAQTIIVLGRDMRALLLREYGLPEKKVRFIPHWSPSGQTVPTFFSQSRLIRRLGLEDKWVVQYSGNMGLWHDMDTLVRAAELLRGQEKIHFLFAGSGRRRQGAEQLAQRLGLRNATWIDPVPLNDLDDLLAGCHVALVSQREGLTGIAVPCKLYGILAAGRPVLAAVPPDCETALVVSEAQCGAVVPPHDPQALADCLLRWCRDQNLTDDMGRRANEAHQRNYTLEHAVERFREVWQI